MADYYPLLAKALANLPNRAAPTARRAIYERARKALIGQLRSIQPPMPEGDIAGEDRALDQAIARLETEYGAQTAPGGASSPAAASPKPAPAAPPPAPSAARPAPPAARAPALSPKPPEPAANPLPRTPVAPPPRQPSPASSAPFAPPPRQPAPASSAPLSPPPPPRQPEPASPSPVAAPAARVAPSIEPARPFAGGGASASTAQSLAPPVAARRESSGDDASMAPPVAASPPAALGIPPARAGAGIAISRPNAPGRAEAPRRNLWPLVIVAALIFVVGAIAVAAYLWREKPQDMAVKAPGETADKTSPAGQNKIAERIKAAGDNNPPPASAPAAGETTIPTVTVPVAPVQVAPAPAAAASPVLQSPAAPQVPQVQAQAQPQAQAAPAAVAGMSRAAMLIGVASDPQKPMVNLGTAVWSIIPATGGQPSTLAVRIEVDIPDQKMHATVTIRKNSDASLPATHTIDLRATFADGAEIKGVKDMGLPQLRKEDTPTGDAISGVRVKINDSYYLVGLTRSDADAAHNLDLLASRNWFDFPLLLNDDRIAKLTFTKGEAGDKAMAQALDAWK